MGTRADFYIGRGQDATWLGGIPFDGFPSGVFAGSIEDVSRERMNRSPLLQAQTDREFALVVSQMLSMQNGFSPKQGWPWPWEDSGTTDYAYTFENGEVWVSHYGSAWYQPHRGQRKPRATKKDDALDDAERILYSAQNAAQIWANLHTGGVLTDEQKSAHARMQKDVDTARAACGEKVHAVFPDMTEPKNLERAQAMASSLSPVS